jgi:3',5'-cyclic AMP phosphodiesterase CpdA
MIVAQISDLHVKPAGKRAYRIVDTAAHLKRAVARLTELDPRPDLVIASGDLADEGLPEEYARLRALLEPLPIPYYLLMGNHDERSALRAAFPDHRYLGTGDGPVQYVIDGPLRIVVADTTAPGIHSGVLDRQRLAWIDATLGSATDRPAMLVLHHPPFATGISALDAQPYPGAAELGAIVRRHTHVERVACGHLHRPILTRWHGTIAMTVPSTAHQITLDLRDGAPDTFTLEPPAFALHVWDGASLTTHFVPIEPAAGPYPFRESGQLIA